MATGSGKTMRDVSEDKVLRVQLGVPRPAEQGCIVAKIEKLFSDLDAGIAALERAKANLKRYRAALLKPAVEGKLTEDWRVKRPNTEPASKLLERILTERRRNWEREQLGKFAAARKEPPRNWRAKYVEPTQVGTIGLPSLPDSWCWASEEQIATHITKGSSGGWQRFDYSSRRIPFIRSQNVRWRSLVWEDLVFLPQEFNDTHQGSIVRSGDVLLNLVGASIGRAAVAVEEIDGANTNQAVGIIRLAPGSVSSYLLVQFLLSPDFNRTLPRQRQTLRGPISTSTTFDRHRYVCRTKWNSQSNLQLAEKFSQIEAA
jgi:type I restriction enzyme, S subunit